MSRFCTTSSHQHHVQSTSMTTSPTETGDVNGGHCASPYLRRFRIPKLNTFRHHLEEDEDDDEWFEMQMSKNDLIRLRMNELKNNRLKDRTNNNVRKSQSLKNTKTSASPDAAKQIDERSDAIESCNGNRDSGAISEMQTTMRCLWFHPKHLFEIAPSPQPTALKTAVNSDH